MAKWFARGILASGALIVLFFWVQLNRYAMYANDHMADKTRADGYALTVVGTLFLDLVVVIILVGIFASRLVRIGMWIWRTAELRPRRNPRA